MAHSIRRFCYSTVMAATGKPKSPGELEKEKKEKKYDRQLRLWGDHGQSALESARVCLINATATGTEILKNLILPGIGAFTIVDGNIVNGADIGNNFFLEKDSIGESRARIATELLRELNADVRGDFLDECPERILEGNPKYFSNFSIVIATGLTEKTLLSLGKELWQDDIPLLVCRAYGMIGYMRLQVPEHTVIEAHPDNVIYDLHLDNPFPALKNFVDSMSLEQMDYKDHSHTPYVVILLKYLEKWKELNNGSLPQTREEKNEFREMIKTGIQRKDEGNQEEEENFIEANNAVNTAISKTKVPDYIESLFTDPLCLNLTTESKPFWIMTRALKEFIETDGHGCLPVRGAIPDMTADTERYVKLQNIYRLQAHEDVLVVYNKVQQLLKSIGKPQDFINENEVKLFCKNSHCLKVIKVRSLADEYNPETAKVQDIMMRLHNPDSDTDVMFYILLRAVDRFYSDYNRFPGYFSEQVEPDIVKLKSYLCRIVQEWGCGPLSKDDYIHEMCRFGAAELHSIAAFIGGCASQEAVKLITGQYVPFNNTFIYNAMTETTTVYNL